MKITFFSPKEVTAELSNPERGFYSICKYEVTDDISGKYEMPYSDERDVLLLLEINLHSYTSSEISQPGLDNICMLFNQMRIAGYQLIVRFLYDTEGKNLANEPRSLDIILNHMRQVAPIIKENADIVYVLQGLFIGDWGEMHGTRYSQGDSLKKLYTTLSDLIDDAVPVSVRTPAQWRSMLGFLNTGERAFDIIRSRPSLPGLFNDGMFGSISDLGTYGNTKEDRDSEIAFQYALCRYTPNGGEAVGNDIYSAPERALSELAKTHVSYLGRYHDMITLGSWQTHIMQTNDLWNGMSFFDYVGSHLGYRFVISDVRIKKAVLGKKIIVSFCIKNIGFAPIYHDVDIYLDVKGTNRMASYLVEGNVRDLYGMANNVKLSCSFTIQNEDLPNDCDFFVRLYSKKYDCTILTANEDSTESGVLIGGVVK